MQKVKANFDERFPREYLGKSGYIIVTQYMEDYGYKWKFKGGDAYFFECESTPLNMVEAAEKAVTINNEAAKELVVSIRYETLTEADVELPQYMLDELEEERAYL